MRPRDVNIPIAHNYFITLSIISSIIFKERKLESYFNTNSFGLSTRTGT